MAKQPAKNINIAIGAVVIEDDVSSSRLGITQEVPEVTSYADAGPRRVVGNYDWSLGLEGFPDFASGQSDATLFALVGDADGAASAYDPTGAAAGANDPNYDGTIVLESYEIAGAVGGPVTFSASLPGTSALTRAVA